MVFFALHSLDFEPNCFWLLVEKFRHSRQNCIKVYVARFRRKQIFWDYSTLHIDARYSPNFFLSLLKTFKQGRMFRWVCQNWTLCASENFFTKHRFLKKYILSETFSVSRRHISRFEAKKFRQVFKFCIQFVWKKISTESFAGNKCFLIAFLGFYAFHFLWIYAAFYWQCCQHWTLCFHRIVFMGNFFFAKKNFLTCLSLFRPKFFGFTPNVFLQGCQNCILCVQRNNPWGKDFQKPCFF